MSTTTSESRLIYKLPVEIWAEIFGSLFNYLSAQDDTGVGAIEDLGQFETKMPLFLRLGVERTHLLLTCRYFRDILQPPRNQLTILEYRDGESPAITVTTTQTGHSVYDTERLEASAPIDHGSNTLGPVPWPPGWSTQSWQSLKSLVLNSGFPFDPIPILSRAPNLRLLGCGLRTDRIDTGDMYPVLLHPQLNQLTHLSLYPAKTLAINVPLPELTLPSLTVLQFELTMHDLYAPAPEELIPWTLPSLRTLALRGKVDIVVCQQLQPFLDRHASIVINLANDLTCWDHIRPLYLVILHFQQLQVYSVEVGSILGRGLHNIPSTLPPQMHGESPILLLTGICDPCNIILKRSAFESTPSRIINKFRVLTRVMLDEPWQDIRVALGRNQKHAIDFKTKITALLNGFQDLGAAVVDRHGVEMPRATADWLDSGDRKSVV